MKYYLHRISHEWDVSYPLLDNGLLSIGWSAFGNRKFLDKVRNDSIKYLDKMFLEKWQEKPRNRYSLMRFIVEIDKDDIILVPKGRSFSIYKVLEKAVPISEIDLPKNLHTALNKPIIFKDGLLYVDDEIVDLGFTIKVQKIDENISRYDYADADLTARMKIHQTNADITDLAKNIDDAINAFKAGKPLNLRSEIIENNLNSVLDSIKKIATPDKLEDLIKWYCNKIGASSVNIPSKNEAYKKGDADVVATFENLQLILYIQAKFHEEETDSWAIEQISDYYENISDIDDGYSRIAWVITTADKYSQEAIEKAKEKNIKLITGNQFAEMLLDTGFSGLDI